MQFGVWELGIDRDEREVALERAPRRGDDAAQGIGRVAALGLGRFDCRGGFGDRRLGPGVEQRVTGGTAAISPISPASPPGEPISAMSGRSSHSTAASAVLYVLLRLRSPRCASPSTTLV